MHQRLFPFMVDHVEPLPLAACVFLVVEQHRRAIVRRVSVGTPERWAMVDAGIVRGGLFDVATSDFPARVRAALDSEQRAAANLAAALRGTA